MIRLGICSDNVKTLEILKRMVETQYGEQIQIQTYQPIKELIALCKNKRYVPFDIAIIDLTYQRETGIKLAQKLEMLSKKVKIIFVTEYYEYVKDIFAIEPVCLLKKPISVIKLVEAIDKAIEKISLEESQTLTLYSKGTIFQVNAGYISYVETDNRKLLIHQNENEISIYMKMDELEGKLGEIFLRCHHSYLVNMKYIMNFTMQEIKLLDGTIVPVSRPKSAAAKMKFLAYLGELS